MAKLEEIKEQLEKQLKFASNVMDKIEFRFIFLESDETQLEACFEVIVDGGEMYPITNPHKLRDWLCEMLGNPSLTDEP